MRRYFATLRCAGWLALGTFANTCISFHKRAWGDAVITSQFLGEMPWSFHVESFKGDQKKKTNRAGRKVRTFLLWKYIKELYFLREVLSRQFLLLCSFVGFYGHMNPNRSLDFPPRSSIRPMLGGGGLRRWELHCTLL